MTNLEKNVYTVLCEKYSDALDVEERYNESMKYDEVIIVSGVKDAEGKEVYGVMAI